MEILRKARQFYRRNTNTILFSTMFGLLGVAFYGVVEYGPQIKQQYTSLKSMNTFKPKRNPVEIEHLTLKENFLAINTTKASREEGEAQLRELATIAMSYDTLSNFRVEKSWLFREQDSLWIQLDDVHQSRNAKVLTYYTQDECPATWYHLHPTPPFMFHDCRKGQLIEHHYPHLKRKSVSTFYTAEHCTEPYLMVSREE